MRRIGNDAKHELFAGQGVRNFGMFDPDVAVVDIDSRLSNAAGAPLIDAHALFVAAREHTGWQFQNMVPVGIP